MENISVKIFQVDKKMIQFRSYVVHMENLLIIDLVRYAMDLNSKRQTTYMKILFFMNRLSEKWQIWKTLFTEFYKQFF